MPLSTPGVPVEAARQGLRLWTQHAPGAPDLGRHRLLRVDTGLPVVSDGDLGVAEAAVRAALYGVPKVPQLLEAEEDRDMLVAARPVLRREPAADPPGLWAWRWYDSADDLDDPAAAAASPLVPALPYDYANAVREARYARMAALTYGDPRRLAVLRRADYLCQVRAVPNCARFGTGAQPADPAAQPGTDTAAALVATCVRCRGHAPAVGVTAALAWLG